MPTLYTKDGASAVFETPAEVEAALASGQWMLPESGRVGYVSPTGVEQQLTPEALSMMPGNQHYGVESGVAGSAEALEGAVHNAYSGLGDQLIGAGEGAASVLSLGVSDLALDALGADTALRKEHTVGRTVGEIAGIVGTAFAPGLGAAGAAALEAGGALSRAQKVGRLLLKTPGGAVSKFGAGGKGALARVAHMAGEGAAYGVGQAISNVALAEPGLTAEQVISELGQGALLGGALGGAVGGIGVGAGKFAASRAARRGVLDLEKGVAKEALATMSKAQKTVDEFTDFAAAEGKKNAKEIRKAVGQVGSHSPRARGVGGGEVDATLLGSLDEFAAPGLPGAAGVAQAAGAGVPVMITKQMRADLKAAGWMDDTIDQMTPKEAWEALRGVGRPKAAPSVDSLPLRAQGGLPGDANSLRGLDPQLPTSRFSAAQVSAAQRDVERVAARGAPGALDDIAANPTNALQDTIAQQAGAARVRAAYGSVDNLPLTRPGATAVEADLTGALAENAARMEQRGAVRAAAGDVRQQAIREPVRYAQDAVDVSKLEVKFANNLEEALANARGPAVNKYKLRAAFDLKPGEAVGPDAFKRLFKMAEKQPEEFVKRVRMVGDYFESAKAATANNPVAKARVADALSEFDAAIGKLVDPDTALKLSDPKVIGGILAAETGIEMLPDGPAKNLLRMGAAYKLLGGIGAIRGGGNSLISRAAKSIGRRYSAGYMSGVVRTLPIVQRMSPQVATGLTGAGASGGYELFNFADRLLNGRALKSAMTSQATAQSTLAAAVDRVATGKPVRARAMPAMNLVLDRLAGEPEGSKRTPQEKFKTVQERLAKYGVAPDAAMNSVYEMLKPLGEASEQLADLAESVLGVQLDYLLQKMPKDPGTNVVLGKSMWQPSDRELYEFTAYAMGVVMPLETIDLIADGLVPPQAAHALAATNPELFTKFQFGIMERADEVRANSTYNQRIALGLAFQVPLEPTADPRYVAFMQDNHAQKTMAQAAGEAGEANTPEESYSDAQKLLS